VHRTALAYWAVVLALAAVAAGVVGHTVAAADQARERWGRTRPVVVARRALAPGHALSPGDVAVRAWPVGLVPPAALARRPAPGTVVRTAVGVGQPVVPGDLGRRGRSGPGALLGTDRRAVAVPRAEAPLPVRVGDTVDLYAVGADGTGLLVSPDAAVLAVSASTLTVAVPAGEVAGLVGPLSDGLLVPALSTGS